MESDAERCMRAARAALEAAQRHVAQEISTYPTPISGCDAQFNHLLATRRKIGDALDALGRDVFIPTPRTPELNSGVESR